MWDDWALIREKMSSVDPELVEEMIVLMDDIRVFIRRGENDRVRKVAEELADRIKGADGPRGTILRLAHMAATVVPFEVDDPENDDDEFIFRSWRTVERGYTVMDARAALDPSHRCFPRKEYSIREEEDATVVTEMTVDPSIPDES